MYPKRKWISWNVFNIQMSGLHHDKGKLSKVFSSPLPTLVDFNVGTPIGTKISWQYSTSVHILKRAVCYHSHSIPYAGFQLLKICYFWPSVWSYPHNPIHKGSSGVTSGDLGGQATDVPLLTHPPDSVWLRCFLTTWL
jgi:hypothetical protein